MYDMGCDCATVTSKGCLNYDGHVLVLLCEREIGCAWDQRRDYAVEKHVFWGAEFAIVTSCMSGWTDCSC